MTNLAATHQPPPAEGGEVVLFQVIEDLKARAEFGAQKHGTLLRTNNGRSAVWDAYQEILDFVMYFRQYIIEQEMQHEEPPATSLQMQVQRMSLGIVNTNNETRLRMDEIEERLDEIAKAIDGLTTNMNYMAAKRGINLLNVSGYPRTHE